MAVNVSVTKANLAIKRVVAQAAVADAAAEVAVNKLF
jgi:hypothetical protein